MKDDLGQWQWVDEDPFEKLVRAPKDAGVAGSPGESVVKTVESARVEVEEAPVNNVTIGDSEPEQTVAQSPVEPIAINGQARTADTDLAAVTAERRDPAADQFELAVSLERLEQWEEAANSFRRALEVDPGRVEALLGLGACLLHLEAAEEALNCFKQCLFSDVGRKRALLGKGVALQKLARYDDADRAYRELLQTSPDSPEPLANLIALSVARRDTAAVAEYSRRLLRVDPNAKAALQGLATLAIGDGNQAAAVDYCTRLMEVDPKSLEGRHNLAFAKQKMHPPEQAMRSIA
jgi:tetratricopeptide (TPR) repeat protein